jgi:hypothetical protein
VLLQQHRPRKHVRANGGHAEALARACQCSRVQIEAVRILVLGRPDGVHALAHRDDGSHALLRSKRNTNAYIRNTIQYVRI